MNIILFGVSNIGKSVTDQLLAARLGFEFYDLDGEVKKFIGASIEEFVNTGSLFYRDQIRCELINRITKIQTNKVLAVTPLSYIKSIRHLFFSNDTLAIELQESVQNIFDRLLFSDENDRVYKDDEYKNQHRDFYISEIKDDISWYGRIYSEIKNKFDMGGNPPETVVDQIIRKYHLDRNETIGECSGTIKHNANFMRRFT
jgi:shikimate kinase